MRVYRSKIRLKQRPQYGRSIIIKPRWRDYFKIDKFNITLGSNFYYQRKIFNPLFLTLPLIIFCYIFGLFFREFIILGLTWLLIVIYLYFRTLKIAEGLILKRDHPLEGREGDEIQVKYTLINRSHFALKNIVLMEKFNGTQDILVPITTSKNLASRTATVINHIIKLNGGMGEKKFHPLTLSFCDVLGLFQFSLVVDRPSKIQVYPKIELVPKLPYRGSEDSFSFGLFDMVKRGESTNFMGAREYRFGDPIKHINWKLSAKAQNLIINEFEKNVNSTTIVLLNLDSRAHMGQAANSTWEYCKDITLGLATEISSTGNEFAFKTQEMYIQPGMGPSQMAMLELKLPSLGTYSRDKKDLSLVASFMKHQGQLIHNQTTVFYISPLCSDHSLVADLDSLRKLALLGVPIIVILVDGFEELIKLTRDHPISFIHELKKRAENHTNQWIQGLRILNAKVFRVKMDSNKHYSTNLFESLLKEEKRWEIPSSY